MVNEKIKKFKNSNVNITFEGTIEELERFYHNEININDLYFYHDGGSWFLVDTNKSNVYYLTSYFLNIFEYLTHEFFKMKTLKFYPEKDQDEVNRILSNFYEN